MFKEIKINQIRNKVIRQIKTAKKEILATMNVNEEKSFPTPSSYFLLIGKKTKEGIKIKRLVFGSFKKYKLFLKEIKTKRLFFRGNYTKSKNYKRMIMIDRSKLFFQTKINKKPTFYFTDDEEYIQKYLAYFYKIRSGL